MGKTIQRPPHIGIDIGRVIMAPIKGGRTDTSFLKGNLARALETPPSPGALEGVRRLVEAFDGQAWLVSKAGPSVQHKTKHWLRHWDFYRQTGLPRSNLRFCLKRPEKAGICRQLLITHFIDDRLDVLEHLCGVTDRLYLFGEQPRLDRIPDWVVHVANWQETTERVLADLSDERGMPAATFVAGA